MVELLRQKLNWSSLTRVEQLALISSILIWVGVVLFGGGLYLGIRNHRLEQQAFAQATAIATAAPSTPTPTATTEAFPVGWATATPTITPLPTSTPTITPTPDPLAPTATNTPPTSRTQESAPKPANAPPDTGSGTALVPAPAPPDRIVIPAIDLDATVVPIGWFVVEQGSDRYSIWQVADNAVSWHNTSALPGHNGNVVLNGHHNIKGEVFRYLVDLEVGDRVVVYVGDQAYHYAVSQKMILKERGEPADVRRDNARWIAPTQEEQLTMVTCWPYTNNTHRLVVVAKPAPPLALLGLEE